MLYNEVVDLYKKFRLMNYKSLFGKVGERDGSLSAMEAFSVDAIYLLDQPTIKQFSEFLGISQPNATYKINSLMEKGYVTKVASEDDKREYRLHVSEKFYNYLDSRSQFISNAVERLQGEFTEEELDTFEKMLWALNKSVK